jgi:hypothetical protein
MAGRKIITGQVIKQLFLLGGCRARIPLGELACIAEMSFGSEDLLFHGVEAIQAGTSDLLVEGGRINLVEAD